MTCHTLLSHYLKTDPILVHSPITTMPPCSCVVRTTQNNGIPNEAKEGTRDIGSNNIDTFSVSSKEKHLTKRGTILLGVFGGLFAGIYAVTTPFVSPALRRICLPFVPATPIQIRNVFTALSKRSGTLIDIGSGDGRIVLEAARRGFSATGVELNYWLILYSRFTAWKNGLSAQTNYFRKDLWKTDLSNYENVVVFGVEQMMPQLEEKLDRELEKGRNIVACRFPFPTWEADKTIGTGVDTVWLYIKHHNEITTKKPFV